MAALDTILVAAGGTIAVVATALTAGDALTRVPPVDRFLQRLAPDAADPLDDDAEATTGGES